MPFVSVRNRFMSEQKMIAIEVAYALPDEQVILTVQVAEGTSAVH